MDTQLFLSIATPMPELFKPVKNRRFVKPEGGLWTSTWDAGKQSSAWVDWCRDEDFDQEVANRWFLLTPYANARILTIDTVADMETMYKQYPDQMPSFSFLNMIDFERMAQDYDAMRVTERGQWATRLSHPRNLYGWDCESTCWFRWSFSQVKEIAVPVLEAP